VTQELEEFDSGAKLEVLHVTITLQKVKLKEVMKKEVKKERRTSRQQELVSINSHTGLLTPHCLLGLSSQTLHQKMLALPVASKCFSQVTYNELSTPIHISLEKNNNTYEPR